MKKVLFISIGFYDYDIAITNQFKKIGYEVDYFSEVPENTVKYRYHKKKNNKEALNKINRIHTNTIVKNSNKHYDLVFIIKCENISEEDILGLRKKNPKAKFVLYLWDSVKRISGINTKIKLFDSAYSFDRVDCMSNKSLKFNPLFFRNEYNNNIINDEEPYDIYHLGWYHSDRLKVVKKILQYSVDNGIKYKLVLFTGYFTFLLHSIFGGELKGNKKNLIFKAISSKDNFINMKKSKTVLDITHPLQNGLTMRTIELLGMKKKIITTNSDIINYDFYNSNNILVIDRENPSLDLSFFKSKYVKVSEDIRLKYSISNWLTRMVK